ncbi:AsmA family protein [Achromobacter sp. GG226]|uniref:AsmA family protein n=1 Tax=Verticiella alkaliphila TaxID=2779529 RepID=UPI001C0BB25C|nr:AsmA family protein [Verticiella sp. GG226]MBU4613051.1 AsmA family protein [Verticiella sp. GG226]
MSWVRRLVIALGALVLLTGIVLVALVLFINPNDYKSTLVDLVKERYDRTLVIDGDIRLSVMPRLGLEIGGVSISEPHSNQVFAAVDSARAAVAFWPLFSRHLVIEHLTLTGVKANVVRDAGGHFNFDDLLHAPAPAGEPVPAVTENPASADGSIQLAVGSVTVSGGDVALRDERQDMALRLERLNVSATGIATGKAFDVSAAARLLGQSPRADATVQVQARLGVDAAEGRYSLRNLDLRMAGVLPSVKANAFGARGDAAYDAQSGTLTLNSVSVGFQGDLALATPLTNVDAQLVLPQLVLDTQGDRLAIEGLVGKAQGRLGAAPFTAAADVPSLAVDDKAASGGPVQLSYAQEGEGGMSVRLGLTGISGTAGRLAVAQAELKASLRRHGRTAGIELTSPATASLTGRTFALSALDAKARIEGVACRRAV